MTPIDFTNDQNNMRKVIDDQNTHQRQNFKISYCIITQKKICEIWWVEEPCIYYKKNAPFGKLKSLKHVI